MINNRSKFVFSQIICLIIIIWSFPKEMNPNPAIHVLYGLWIRNLSAVHTRMTYSTWNSQNQCHKIFEHIYSHYKSYRLSVVFPRETRSLILHRKKVKAKISSLPDLLQYIAWIVRSISKSSYPHLLPLPLPPGSKSAKSEGSLQGARGIDTQIDANFLTLKIQVNFIWFLWKF